MQDFDDEDDYTPSPEVLIAMTEANRKFTKFCTEMEETNTAILTFIQDKVKLAMHHAGENPDDAVTLACRVHQVTYSLSSAAQKEYDKAMRDE